MKRIDEIRKDLDQSLEALETEYDLLLELEERANLMSKAAVGPNINEAEYRSQFIKLNGCLDRLRRLRERV